MKTTTTLLLALLCASCSSPKSLLPYTPCAIGSCNAEESGPCRCERVAKGHCCCPPAEELPPHAGY